MLIDSVIRFFAMGGYAFYVWLAYGVSLLVLALNVILAARSERQVMKEITRIKQLEQLHKAKAKSES